jgi:hypothetical protein
MAARTVKIRHDEETRAKIQTSQLINRLQSYVLGEVQLEPGQVTAALGLMKKTLPDLTATELSGDADNPVAISHIQRTIVDPRNPDSQGTPPAT